MPVLGVGGVRCRGHTTLHFWAVSWEVAPFVGDACTHIGSDMGSLPCIALAGNIMDCVVMVSMAKP